MKIDIRKKAQLTGHKAAIYSLTPGSEPHLILSGAGDGWIVQWDLHEPDLGKLVAKVDTNIFSLLYLKDQNMVVAGNMNGGVHWVNLSDPDLTKNIAHHKNGVFDIQQFDGFIYTLGGDGVLTKWSAEEARTLESIQLSHKHLRSMAYHPERNEIAVGASDHNIYLLKMDTLEVKHTIKKAHQNSVFSLQYHPTDPYLISGGRDAHMNIWNLNDSLSSVHSISAHWFTINHIAFHPKAPIFATASRDKTIRVWHSRTFELLKVLNVQKHGCHINSVNRLYWCANPEYLISCSDDRSIILWEVKPI